MARQRRLTSSKCASLRLIDGDGIDGAVPTKRDFMESRAKCQMCSLWDSCRSPLVLDRKDVISKVKYVFVGEAPGEGEDIQGLPFVGKSGQLLRDCLQESNFDMDEVYFSNILKCRPPRNATPTDTQMNYCLDFLVQELLLLKPKVIVLLGAVATKAFGFSKAISLLRGSVFSGKDIGFLDETQVFCLFHPAYILRNMDALEDFIADLQVIKKYDPSKFKVIEDTFYLDKENNLNDILLNSKVVAIDIETDGLDFPLNILSCAISNGIEAVCFKWDQNLIKILDYVFESVDIIIAHNFAFEYKAFLQDGFDCSKYLDKMRDTMLMSALLNENRTHNLKDLSYLVGFGGYESRLLPCHISKLAENDIESWYKYNCADTYVTLKLYEKMLPEIQELKLEYLLKQLSKYQAVVAELETNGVRVDMELLSKYQKSIAIDVEKLDNEMRLIPAVAIMQKDVGKKLNFNSSQQLVKLITKYMKIEITEKTKKGADSVAAKVIQSLARDYKDVKFFRLLLIYKKLTKLQSTYIDGYEDYVSKSTGRIYPSYNLLGALTGRTSSSNPNFQNIPRKYTDDILKDYNIRSIFIPRAGFKLLQVDYSQLELRVMAALSPEEVMLECFRNGEDLHQKTADALKIVRNLAKSVNFGLLFGGDEFTLMGVLEREGIEIDRRVAGKYCSGFFELYPGLEDYYIRIEYQLENDGYVKNYFHRRRRFYNYKQASEYQQEHIKNAAFNAPVQSTAKDIFYIAMNELFAILKGFRKYKEQVYLIGDVHDAMLFEIRTEVVESFCKLLRTCMVEHFDYFPCPLDIDISIGDSWGTLKGYESVDGV